MTKNEIIQYVINTPENSNPNVLRSMLDELSAGGDSDFSIANVTINGQADEPNAEVQFVGCIVDSNQLKLSDQLPVGTTNIQLILYKQQTPLFIYNIQDVSYTDNCIFDELNSFIVTGDCEINCTFETGK